MKVSADAKYRSLLLILLALNPALTLVSGDASQCSIDPSVPEGDRKMVAEVIKLLEPLYGKKVVAKAGSAQYSVCVCCDAAGGQFPNAMVVNITNPVSEGILGLRNRTVARRGEDWVEATFLSDRNYTTDGCEGSHKSARLTVTCDHDITSAADVSIVAGPSLESDCYTQLSTRHCLACSEAASTSLGFFWILIIILVVGFGSYFLLGFLYMRFVKGAQGIDQIPHREYWFTAGNNFSDCVGMICRCDRYCGASSSPSADDYLSVDGTSAFDRPSPSSSAGGVGVPPYSDNYQNANSALRQPTSAAAGGGGYGAGAGPSLPGNAPVPTRNTGSDTDLLQP